MRRRTTAAAAATALLGAGAAGIAAGRLAARATLGSRAVAAAGPPGFPAAGLVVHTAAADRITLTRSLDSLRPGRYGLAHDGDLTVVGPVLDGAGEPDTVARRLPGAGGGAGPGHGGSGVPFAPGTLVHLTPQTCRGDPERALGIASSDVRIDGELGPLPAWFVPGARDTWVIALHGLGTTREHPLNVLPFLHRHRFPVLLPAYRGDPDAPRPPDRMHRLGAAEWRDAAAAVDHALRGGARRVVLYGWSVGATMALYASYAASPELRFRIAGLVLDSPVLDPAATLRALALRRGVPAPLLPLAVRAARGALDLGPGLLPPPEGPAPATERRPDDAAGPPGQPTVPGLTPPPVLLLHGPDDTVAPWAASRRLAARQPQSVTLHGIPDAEHAAGWNVDPEGYEETLRRFLTPLM